MPEMMKRLCTMLNKLWLSRSFRRMGRLEEALEHDLKYSVEENQMNTEEEASAYKAKIRNTFKKGGPEAICSARIDRQYSILLASSDVYKQTSAAITIAKLEAANGKNERAIELLGSAFRQLQRSGLSKGFGFHDIAVDPAFADLHGDSRFQHILREIGFTS